MSDKKDQRPTSKDLMAMNEEINPLNKTDSSDKRFTAIVAPSKQEQDTIAIILDNLKKSVDSQAIQIAFDEDPSRSAKYSGLFKNRGSGVPYDMLKRVRDTEEMVGAVVLPARARQASLFGHPRPNRFDIGFTINIKPYVKGSMNSEQIEKLKQEEIPKIREILLNCGDNEGYMDKDKLTLSEYIYQIIEDGLTFGWFASEVRKDDKGRFHSFRPVDAGTIYQYDHPEHDDAEAAKIRAEAKRLLSEIKGEKVDMNTKIDNDQITWVQVIGGSPKQVFTDDELLVYKLYPSTDIKRNGYPISPIERILSAVVTHINITTHNKMYFLNGRAARNILVFQSENLDVEDIKSIRSQMQAHINSANASWRMPVFGVGAQDKVSVMPIDGQGRDMEFQYLADLTKRIIFAAYQMSPDEVAAMSYLSRGTSSQSLSEGNNEYKLEAARDLGLRPLLRALEAFFNERLLPLINKEWSKQFFISLEGLDADTPEKEATRIQQDSNIYLTMDDIMDRVEKQKVPIGGKFPLNTAYLQLIEKYFTKGEILSMYGGDKFKDAGDPQKHPEWDYYIGDAAGQTYLAVKQQMAQAQAQKQNGGASGQNEIPELVDQLSQLLTKSEADLPATRKELLKKHKEIKSSIMNAWESESKAMLDQIMAAVEGKHEKH